ncbi:hypothetical protein C8D89_10267 [Actinomycetospora cinnamomea]|uniref:Uncharacterized protein n=1 Tax=Actinomycetospora cinnamomea TaxID=663609 RepID=A0A2U1FL83_9PSEU|nr:hypothetical protein C8D89_10267 [Actinomycetospora cinnamomea]
MRPAGVDAASRPAIPVGTHAPVTNSALSADFVTEVLAMVEVGDGYPRPWAPVHSHMVQR